jgi:hypothetical protein
MALLGLAMIRHAIGDVMAHTFHFNLVHLQRTESKPSHDQYVPWRDSNALMFYSRALSTTIADLATAPLAMVRPVNSDGSHCGRP